MPPHVFPSQSIGTLYRAGSARGEWQRWLPAVGPVRLWPSAVALDATGWIADHFGALPKQLGGLGLTGLGIDDDDLGQILRGCRRLKWLDIRGCAVTAAGLEPIRRCHVLDALAVDDHLHAAATALTARRRLSSRVRVTGDNPVTLVDPTPDPSPAQLADLLARARQQSSSATALESPADAAARAAAFIDVGRPLDAVAALAPVLSSGHPGATAQLASAAWKLNEIPAALAALEYSPPAPALMTARARILARICPDSALDACDDALALNPFDYAALWQRANTMLAARQPEAATIALQTLERIDPANIDTIRMRGFIAESATNSWPTPVSLRQTIASHREESRAARQAAEAWQQIVAIRPDDPEALAHLAATQEGSRPWTMKWTATLHAAEQLDPTLREQRRSLADRAARHRRGLGRLLAFPAMYTYAQVGGHVDALIGTPTGIAVAVGVAVALAVSGALWLATPRPVRRTIQRTDELMGTHRRPDWRRAAAGVLVASLCVSFSSDFTSTTRCWNGESESPCPPLPGIPIPTIPTPPTIPQPLRIPTYPPAIGSERPRLGFDRVPAVVVGEHLA